MCVRPEQDIRNQGSRSGSQCRSESTRPWGLTAEQLLSGKVLASLPVATQSETAQILGDQDLKPACGLRRGVGNRISEGRLLSTLASVHIWK